LPDSLKKYAEFLPKQATVYFKDDSTASIQGTTEESTTVITDKKTGFMRVLLKSPFKMYRVDYDKTDQENERALLPVYSFAPTATTKQIAGYNAVKYILKDKLSGDTSEAWFTKDISIIPNSITTALDPKEGVPLVFTTNQHGVIATTTVKQITFDAVPAGVFSTPAGYEVLTPKQLQEMPVEN
jgi:hypothetical protein